VTNWRRHGVGAPAAPEFPLHVLSEYALLADGERGTLVGPRGDSIWTCAPRWDSDAVFSALTSGAGVHVLPLESAQRLAAPWPSDTQDNRR